MSENELKRHSGEDEFDPKQPEQTKATHRSLLHVQVAGTPSAEDLARVAQMFYSAGQDQKGAIVTTPDNVTLFNVLIPSDQAVLPVHVTGAIGPELLAQLTYEINRTYSKHLGDNSFPHDWANAPEDQKAVNRNGVQNHLRNPNLSAKQSHNAWMKGKAADGWTYGPDKDPVRKTHPSMVPYEALPAAVKLKDFLFKTVVDTLRSKLPQVSSFTRQIEVFVAATETWVPGDFTELQADDIFRFVDARDGMFIANATPFLNYLENATQWSIDARPLIQQEPAPESTEPPADESTEPAQEPSYDEVIEEHADEPAGEPAQPDFDGRTDKADVPDPSGT